MRERRDDVQCLVTATRNIVLGEGQYFCRLRKSWEVWGPMTAEKNGRAYCIKRIPEKQVLWVIEKPDRADAALVQYGSF